MLDSPAPPRATSYADGMGKYDRTHRIIYSIAIDALPPITLDRGGNDKSGVTRHRDAKKRLVDLRTGDEFWDGTAFVTVRLLAAFDSRLLTTQEAMGYVGVPYADGYVYKLPASQVEQRDGPQIMPGPPVQAHIDFIYTPGKDGSGGRDEPLSLADGKLVACDRF